MIQQVLESIRRMDGCVVMPPAGLPNLRSGHELPADLKAFYSVCGGASLFAGALFPFEVLRPEDFEPSNLALLGLGAQQDRSDDWYVIARSGGDQFVSIDLSPARMGRCYDSFFDRHAVVGSCAVIATSFSDFLARTVGYEGRGLYWLDKGFAELGDAYD